MGETNKISGAMLSMKGAHKNRAVFEVIPRNIQDLIIIIIIGCFIFIYNAPRQRAPPRKHTHIIDDN